MGCRAPGSPLTTPTPPAPAGAGPPSPDPVPLSKPVGPYSPVVRAGDWLVVSGQIGLIDGALVDGGVAAEVRQALTNLAGLLEGEGASVTDIAKTTIFLRHISDFAVMNEIYAEFMGEHRPARATVAVAGLPLGALFEVEAWAWVGTAT